MATGHFRYVHRGTVDAKLVADFAITTPALRVDRTQLSGASSGTFTWPTGATVCIIVPPEERDDQGRTMDGTLKMTGSVTGDVGQPLSLTQPTIITKGADATFSLTRAGGTSSITFTVVWL